MRRFGRLLTWPLTLLLLTAAAAAAADTTCTVIYVQPRMDVAPGDIPGLTAADIEAITQAVADGMRPGVPQARLLLKQDVAATVQDAVNRLQQSGNRADVSHLPGFDDFRQASVIATWRVGVLGHRTFATLVLQRFQNPAEVFRQTVEVAGGSAQDVTNAERRLGEQAAGTIAGQYYCLALSEHHIAIDFNRVADRQHPFQAKVTDLAGHPMTGREVTFAIDQGSSSVSPQQAQTTNGVATTVFQARQPSTSVLIARTVPPYQDVLEDRATITVFKSGLHINGQRVLDMAKLCADTTGPVGLLMQLVQKLAPVASFAAPGEQMACSGNATEEDDVVITSLQKSADGFTGTAHWQALLKVPTFTMTSSWMNAVGHAQPRTVSFDAAVSATALNGDAHHVKLVVRQFVQGVPTQGGAVKGTATFAQNSLMGMFQQLDKALLGAGLAPPGAVTPDVQQALQNPLPITVPGDQPLTSIFQIAFPMTLPDTATHAVPLSFDVHGTDDTGAYQYHVDGDLDVGDPPR